MIRFLRRAVIVLIVVPLIALAVLHLFFERPAKAALEKEIEAIRAAGEPLLLSEVTIPRVVDEDNRAPLLLQFTNVFVESVQAAGTNGTAVDLSTLWNGRTNETLLQSEDLGRFLHENAPVFDLLEQAAKLPAADFNLDLEKGYALVMPHVGHALKYSRLLALRSMRRLEIGDSSGAARDIETAFKLASSQDNEPTLISFLVGMAARGIALECFMGLVDGAPEAESDLEGVAESYRPLLPANLERAMFMERALMFDVAEKIRRGQFEDLGSLSGGNAGSGNGLRRWLLRPFLGPLVSMSQVELFRGFRHLIGLLDRDPTEIPGAIEEHERHIGSLSRVHILTKILMPAIGSSVERALAHQSIENMFRSCVAIEAYCAQAGNYPQTLEPLVPGHLPALPLDALTGKPLLYSLDENGYRLWSVGHNRIDEGGRAARPLEFKMAGEGEPDDIVWTRTLTP